MDNTLLEQETGYATTQALIDVLKERTRQDGMWGKQDHNPFIWLGILMEEVGETAECMLEIRFGENNPEVLAHLREEAMQTAAVALAIVECLDRGTWTWAQDA